MEEDNPILTEPFYLKKFMQIQRENVILHDSLNMIFKDEELRKAVESRIGKFVFKILEKTPT